KNRLPISRNSLGAKLIWIIPGYCAPCAAGCQIQHVQVFGTLQTLAYRRADYHRLTTVGEGTNLRQKQPESYLQGERLSATAAALPVVRQNGPVSDIGLHYGDLGLPVDDRRESQGMSIRGKTRRHCHVGSA